jgi:PAS domain S-box-containing protein
MSLRRKLILFMLAFLVVAAILGTGALYVFYNLNKNLTQVDHEFTVNRQYVELRAYIRMAVDNARGWGITGLNRYRIRYNENISKVSKKLNDIQSAFGEDPELEKIGARFQSIKLITDKIVANPDPIGDTQVLADLRRLEEEKDRVFGQLDQLSEKSMGSLSFLVSLGERVRRDTKIYLFLLVSITSVSFLFLALFMRRMLTHPFDEMLTATEKVAGGNLNHRINSTRADEFGLIARRFDSMVQNLQESTVKLQTRLRETELLLDVARVAGMTPEVKEGLSQIARTIASKLEKDVCSIFLLRPEGNAFSLEASNRTDIPMGSVLPVDSYPARMVLDTLKPVLIEDTAGISEEELCTVCKSLIISPIIRDGACTGLLIVGKFRPFGFSPDEKDAIMILAHTLGVVIKNAELYSTTKRQLRQISIMYDLSKALTSVYKPEEVLTTISREIAKLTGARICVIRLMENGLLQVKSSYGIASDAAEDMALPVGQGIAGWVVKEGRSLFVEDVSRLPELIRPKTLRVKSAICVPLKIGDTILGTLGLYDKLGEGGAGQPFEIDDLHMAEGFASISAITIEKARIEEEERRRRQEVFEAKKRLDLLFETVQGGIVSLDAEYNILSANRYIERWVDMPLSDIVGKNAREVFHAKGGICPHCAARPTFDTGDINSITQSSGLNYAELTAYPVRDKDSNIGEAVVFIQDITDRILYQEEIMGLYREVAQTKEYLESLINNSADAIITTDIEGNIISVNQAAEGIYGYRESEIVGKTLPFVPEFLMEQEKQFMERIKAGDVIKTETLRKTKEGELLEVSLTLSPIKDAMGEIIGVSGISRDITKKKQVERELIRRNQELSRLFFISSAMRGSLELDRLLRMILTAVTMSDGLGFNRSILFLVDEEKKALRGAMGVGPGSADEAGHIWEGLLLNQRTLPDIIEEIERSPLKKESFFDRLAKALEVPLDEETALTKAVKEKRTFNVTDTSSEPYSTRLVQQLGTQAYAVVPLISRDKVIGALWVDNLFNRRPITEEDMKFLSAFSNQTASAIENARLFLDISMAESELENIFRSISDMVYLTDKDYNLKKVNEAVLQRVKKPLNEIIGKKCYQVFHGTDAPLPTCPHLKTMETKRANIEEYEEPHMGATLLSSTSPLFDAEGNFMGVVHVVRDVTEMKELRTRLQSAERMAALGEVAAKVAHEIRNPLVSVGGFAKRLERKLDNNLKEYATIISGEVDRLEHILKEILGFVREVRISKQAVLLSQMIEDILNLMGSEIAEKGNRVVKELEPVSVLIDPNRMKEALINMITNANQATEGGTITLKVRQRGAEAVLEIGDTGCGIKKSDLGRIFDPFFTTRPLGTGLGLAIAKRIVEEHGGRISVQSEWPGGGSVFRIFLPLKKEG